MEASDLLTRGRWRPLRLAARSIAVCAVVSSWRDADGMLWQPGYLIAVSVPPESINQDLAISGVDFEQDEHSTRARLELVDPKSLGGSSGQGDDNADLDAGGDISGDASITPPPTPTDGSGIGSE